MRKIRKLILLFVWLWSAVLQAATWYVSSTVATSGNGQSWATAWKNSNNIVWGSISAGDTIYFDGGSSGLSYGAFSTITASGNSSNYITIARSVESGRDGIVTIATPFTISGSYIKFDGGDFKQVSGTTYSCGIVFTCSGIGSGIPDGASVYVTGQNSYFKYCYFNGTYGAGAGHSFAARNSSGFTMEYCWFYQSAWQDQWNYEATSAGGSINLINCIFQDNNKPNRTDSDHRDVANPWTGAGGWNLYVTGCIFFNTLNRPGVSGWQGDELLLQIGYGGSGAAALGQVIATNNVFYNVFRTIVFGSEHSGVNTFTLNNNTVRATDPSFGELGTSGASPGGSNNIGRSSDPGYVSATNPLGADGIPFTTDDGFFLSSGSSSAINAGINNGVTTDIRRITRTGLPDLGAYEFTTGAGQVNTPEFNPAAGPYFGTQSITISSTTPSSTIYYTLDNSTPTTGSSVYSTALSRSSGTTLKAFATASGLTDSAVATAIYEINSWTTQSGNVFKTFTVPQQTGSFTWSFRATPTSSTSDTVIGMSPDAVDQYTDMGPIIRFSDTGVVQAYNGTGYAAVNILTYTGGTSYDCVFTINIAAKTYSLVVTPVGGSAFTIATNYAFRSTQSGATDLDNVGMDTTTGTTTVASMSLSSDTTAPTPNPMTFSSVPAAVDSSSVTMTASLATDETSAVEYFFDETSGNPGATDSSWQSSRVYSDSGLNPSTLYTYRVKCRDASLNETSYSTASNVTTAASSPVSIDCDTLNVQNLRVGP